MGSWFVVGYVFRRSYFYFILKVFCGGGRGFSFRVLSFRGLLCFVCFFGSGFSSSISFFRYGFDSAFFLLGVCFLGVLVY